MCAGHCFWGCFGVWRGFGDYYFDEPFCDSRIGWGRWGFASIFCIPFYVGRSACKLARVLEDAEGAGPICIFGLFQQHLWLHESMRDSMARRCASNGSPCFCVTQMLGVCDARCWVWTRRFSIKSSIAITNLDRSKPPTSTVNKPPIIIYSQQPSHHQHLLPLKSTWQKELPWPWIVIS